MTSKKKKAESSQDVKSATKILSDPNIREASALTLLNNEDSPILRKVFAVLNILLNFV